jgi:hypothetical protein
MSVLEVPGTRLYYELHGTGPLLVLAAGAESRGQLTYRCTQALAEEIGTDLVAPRRSGRRR